MQVSKEFISLYLEKEAANIRAELLRENMVLRLELEDLKAVNQVLQSDIKAVVLNAEAKITEKAIDKTLGIIAQVKVWLAIAAFFVSGIIGLGAFLGYNNLTGSLTAMFNQHVTRWMQFDDEKSGGRQALDELRTEAIVNAYMIRLARNYSSGSESLFPLNGPEEKRLLDVLQNPTTKYSNFSDALTVVVKNRGPFRFALSEDDVGKKIAALLSVPEISVAKKMLVLERLQGDVALLPYSRSLLNDEAQDIYARMAAFENVKTFDKELAVSFSQKNLNTIRPDLKGELVLYLAKESHDYEVVKQYLDELIEQKREDWEVRTLQVISGLGETLIYPGDPNTIRLDGLISEFIKLGGLIKFSDPRFGPKYIALELAGASIALAKPGRLLNNSDLVKAVVLEKDSVDWIKKVTDFFQVSDQGILLSTMTVALGEHGRIGVQSGLVLTAGNVNDKVWLRTSKMPGGKELLATWRDEVTGVVHTEIVTDVSRLNEMDFKISFDEKLMESLSYDYRSLTDRL